MIKQIKKISKNNIDFNNLEDYHLSIQLSLDGFSFCIYNMHSKDILHFEYLQFIDEHEISPYKHLEFVEQLYETNTILKHKYTSVSVTHFNNLVTQVPKPIFDKNNLSNYLKYSIKVLENDFITYDELKNSDIVNVYIPFVNVNNFLFDIYGSFIFKHASTVLIESLLNEFKNNVEQHCFVNITQHTFEIVVLKNKKLDLYNIFNFKTKEDFIYYILFIAEQLNLNPEEFQLILMGDIEKESELYKIAYQYVRNVSFYNNLSYNNILEGISSHQHYTLLNQI
ncbi:DUF3822 family protein [Lutibacter sp.]|jgi:hypothetical protein|uniref:DUF3822 family protein n=1 Tax=Lutibacter sp. TaxID=1925666 RepID=UPI001A329600|nr:DUF3822 family protein [Lutibacter sp.]MBI9041351.1 DUF3822 family protein [Lutibacter sp.]